MQDAPILGDDPAPKSAAKSDDKAERAESREIKGNLPYTPSPGSIKSVLDAIILAERPDKFSINFLETVLKLTGGGVRSVPPLLKKMGFLEGDGSPTDRYSRFKTESKRGDAASEGLRSAFSELFRRNEYIDKATEDQVKDYIVEINGLKRNDPVVRHVYNTFDIMRSFVPAALRGEPPKEQTNKHTQSTKTEHQKTEDYQSNNGRIGLSYQINIVLPETENPMVFDAIFKSLKRNLL